MGAGLRQHGGRGEQRVPPGLGHGAGGSSGHRRSLGALSPPSRFQGSSLYQSTGGRLCGHRSGHRDVLGYVKRWGGAFLQPCGVWAPPAGAGTVQTRGGTTSASRGGESAGPPEAAGTAPLGSSALTAASPQGCARGPARSTARTVTPRCCSGPARQGRASCCPPRRPRSSSRRRRPAPWGTSRSAAGWWPGSCRDRSAAWQRGRRCPGTAPRGTSRWAPAATVPWGDRGSSSFAGSPTHTLSLPLVLTTSRRGAGPWPRTPGVGTSCRRRLLPAPLSLPSPPWRGCLFPLVPTAATRENQVCRKGFGFAPESAQPRGSGGDVLVSADAGDWRPDRKSPVLNDSGRA